MNCPACQTGVEATTYEGVQIETCPSCGGEWLDAGELRQIAKAREVRFTEEERRAIGEVPPVTGVTLEDVERGLRCPKCTGTTEPINYGYDSGIVIDRCKSCRGIWLDGGELEKVQMVAEGWHGQLKEILAKHGERLRAIEAKWERANDLRVSRFAFVNALINAVLDIVR
ncbi:MAG TPA: zf-TFIIB domain-containing protein [Phycisphaerae bacterium]|nr:zf-TFIIB domain-containing protein [Phycisphaerae bacterium]